MRMEERIEAYGINQLGPTSQILQRYRGEDLVL
jgi:hypothetical protein